MASRVLVLGGAAAAKQDVAEAVLKKMNVDTTIAWNKVEGNDEDVSYLAHSMTISTKYYTAPVELHVHTCVGDDWASYEACLCVWDAADKSSWSHVQDAVERMQDHSFDAFLSIAVSSNGAAEGESTSLQHALDWCIDHGVEHVPFNLTKSSDSLTNDETSGIDRVVEALQCTMWKSMEMKDGRAAPPVVNHATTVDESRDEGNPAVDLPTTAGVPSPPSAPDTVDDFEALLQQVHAIRSQVTNPSNVSDDERRERAAEMAMKLWSLLGDDDASDSD
ncbi:Aste57867_9313 [Aphanomyces stellatus]|uniref:Aste57867_9313 protein n=1 Tax=Aphanomyces stellatus TaxID=120398 RepID=A0A485KMK5_9STRA|nr:hypothetical protein As57867_009277 [Aphanomyces stellatus]VFT86195.1 Aste57867_9313 [Aphanomyces stellatus]